MLINKNPSLLIEGLLLLFLKTVFRLTPLYRSMAWGQVKNSLRAYLGSPLKNQLPRQGWRGAKLLLTYIECNAHEQTLGNGKKTRSSCSTFLLWAACTCSGFLETGAVSRDFSFHVLEHFSPESQPVVFVNKKSEITNIPLTSSTVSSPFIHWLPWFIFTSWKQVQYACNLSFLSVPSALHVQGDRQK